MPAQRQQPDGGEPTFRGPNPNRAATWRFLQRAGTMAAGGTTAIVVSLIVYYSMHKGLRPQQRLQHAQQKLDSRTTTSEHCAWESDDIWRILASPARYGVACRDFYAFVCERDRGYSPLEQSVVETSKRVAHSIVRRGRNATETAAVLYASCLSSLASPKVSMKKNMRTIPTVLQVKIHNALKNLNTPFTILEAQAFLSRKRLPSYVTFWSDPRSMGEHFLDVRRPLSTFLDESAMVDAFLNAADALHVTDAGVKRLTASDLATIDRELKGQWDYTGRVETVSFQDLVDIEARVTEEDWRRFFGTESLEVSYMSSRVKVRGLPNVRLALKTLFESMDRIDVAVYSLAHVLLPEEMLDVRAHRSRASSSCLGLVRRIFGDAWYTAVAAEVAPMAIVEAQQQWTSVAKEVAAVLKRRIVVSTLFNNYSDVSAAITKINTIQMAATTVTNSLLPPVSGLMSEDLRRSLDPRNLYKNLLAFHRLRNSGDFSTFRFNGFEDPIWRSQKGNFTISGVFPIPLAALEPSFTCGDHFLNYATVGIAVATAMLRAAGGPFCIDLAEGGECTDNTTASEALDKVKRCFVAGLNNFESPVPPNDTRDNISRLVDALILSTTAFQVALEAAQGVLGAKFLSSVSTEMEMRFLARYCRHLCDQQLGTDSISSTRTAAPWARLRCNVAVTNSPMFRVLFKCIQKQQVSPTRCTVL
ncbi:hypothetical protein HPB50_007834 [Hyalomma asiaticum]|uniref:Uncharacterized protein n=1 Tax=Hyalomma asiaticum TaxID=266040 RepID=A0ACB7SHG2_HYAAI|nr:hypothetical protein HPB50_007834 [Hyalomma asiaticum]